MSSVNQRSYAWLDETVEHSEEDEDRAATLMRRWSTIHHEIEQEGFARQARAEDGEFDEPEPDPCETCGGHCRLGLLGADKEPTSFVRICDSETCEGLVGIACPHPSCRDGYDMSYLDEMRKKQKARDDDRDLEMELINDKLAAIGARPMRPYEHWNEDERYMEYMEVGRFGHYDS